MKQLFGTKLLFFLMLSSTSHAAGYIKFSWSMQQRFNRSIQLYDATRHLYDRQIMDFSEGWVVEFTSSGQHSIRNPVFIWEIQGLGNLSNFQRTYSSNRPNLITSGALTQAMATLRMDSIRQEKIVHTNISRSNSGSQPILENPLPPTWFSAPRLPQIGLYKIRLTVKSSDRTSTETYTTSETVALRNIVIACIGDSYASGEGNPDSDGVAGNDDLVYCAGITLVQLAEGKKSDFVDLEINARWFEKLAHRSLRSGYALAAKAIEDADPHSVVTFINLAVSGAEIQDGLLQPQRDREWMTKGQIGYLKDLVGENKIDLLLLSIGGNDIGFSDILKESTTGQFDPTNVNGYLNRIEALRLSYQALNATLKNSFAIDNILIGEYPTHLFSNNRTILTGPSSTGDSTFSTTNQYSCELFNGINGFLTIRRDEIEGLNKIGEALQTIRITCARELGWLYAGGIAEQFKNHGYCSTPDQTFWIQASYSCTNQGDTKGTMHPNHKGHSVIKNSVLKTINPVLFPKIENRGNHLTF